MNSKPKRNDNNSVKTKNKLKGKNSNTHNSMPACHPSNNRAKPILSPGPAVITIQVKLPLPQVGPPITNMVSHVALLVGPTATRQLATLMQT